MAESPEAAAARIAERKRVDEFMKKALNERKAPGVSTTREETAEEKAAKLRQAIINKTAPSGFQALLKVLGG